MFIALPLMFIGIGFMIYLLFAAATYVLPLHAGLSAGFAALHAGASYPCALLLGITAALLVVFFSHMAIQLAPLRHLRTVITLLFACRQRSPGSRSLPPCCTSAASAAGASSSRWRRRSQPGWSPQSGTIP